MAVVFAFPETFGVDSGTERHAFEQTVRTLAAIHDRHVDERELENILAADGFKPPDGVWATFSAAFGTNSFEPPTRETVEAVFRNAGKRCAARYFALFADVAPALRELAAMHVPQALLSAGWGGIEQRRAAVAGFDGPILVGEDLGVDVTSPAAFARVSEAVRLPADRIWFIGTDPRRHIAAARAAGLRTVWLNRGRDPFPLERIAPDHTIATFGELLRVVSGPYTRGLLGLRELLLTALETRPDHCLGASDLLPPDERPHRD